MEAPQYQAPPPPAVDPNTATLAARAQQDDIAAARDNTAIVSQNLMTRYGTSLALAGGSARL